MKSAYLLTTILSVLQNTHFALANATNTRIVGGTTTTIATAPFVVQILQDGSFICGGSVVDMRFIVTAAHCVYGSSASRFTVIGGGTNLGTGTQRKVDRIFLPTTYSSETLKSDVAVLRLVTPFTGNVIKTVALCSAVVPVGVMGRVVGWGYTNENGAVSQQLRSVEVQTISKTSCRAAYSNVNFNNEVADTTFCAASPGKDACYGDSGGPFIYNNKFCGIVSWGYGCARSRYPGVYTSVNMARTFITTTISNNK